MTRRTVRNAKLEDHEDGATGDDVINKFWWLESWFDDDERWSWGLIESVFSRRRPSSECLLDEEEKALVEASTAHASAGESNNEGSFFSSEASRLDGAATVDRWTHPPSSNSFYAHLHIKREPMTSRRAMNSVIQKFLVWGWWRLKNLERLSSNRLCPRRAPS